MTKTEETFLNRFKRQFVNNYGEHIPDFIAEKIVNNLVPGYYRKTTVVLDNKQEISGYLLYNEDPFWVIADDNRGYVTTLVKHFNHTEDYVYLE